MIVVCLSLAWYRDHRRQAAEIKQLLPAISTFWEKHDLWSPSAHLGCEVAEVESRLSSRVAAFEGAIFRSGQGMSDATLRRPTTETLDVVVDLLSDSDAATVLDATRLLALYLEACSGSHEFEPESLAIKQRFQERGITQVQGLLKHPSKEVRQAAALTLGNAHLSRSAIERLREAFDIERDGTTRIHLAWAYYTLTYALR